MDATTEDYYRLLLQLRPNGPAWPEEDNKLLVLAGGLAEAHKRGLDLTKESLASLTVEMLEAWERNYGLPDPCSASAGADTLAERRAALVARKTARGGAAIPYFQQIIDKLGYDATIQERRPFRCGASTCNSSTRELSDGSTINFHWRVNVNGKRIQKFHAGSGRCGIDQLGAIRRAVDLECVLHRYKPGQTVLNVVYE